MTIKYSLAIGFALIAALFGVGGVGCSNSQQSPAAASSAPSANAPNGIATDPLGNAILVGSCYTCHSTGRTAPWYARISPTYLASNSARRVLNFSDWQTYDAQKKADLLKSIAQSVSSGSMPPGDYTLLDHSARLTDDQKKALVDWASHAALQAH